MKKTPNIPKQIINKLLALLLCALLMISTCTFTVNSYEEFNDSNVMTDVLLLIDTDSGEILYSKNSDKTRSIASLTKIMTCILALENIENPESYNIKVTQKPIDDITGIGASTAGFEYYVGETFSAYDIICGMMIPSGCEAAQILAYEIGGNAEIFTKMMNEKAKDIGCENTTFVDPHGVNDNNVSTANDLLKITQYAMNIPLFREIVSKQYYQTDVMSSPFFNTNHLIAEENNCGYYHRYVTGIKTGFTTLAGKCLVSSAKKGNDEFICIALGGTYNAEDDYINHAMTDTADLYDWALKNYTDNIEVEIERTYASVNVNSNIQLNADIIENTTSQNPVVEWTSTDESIATVDENGVVHGKALGQAKIIAKTQTGNYDKVFVSVGFQNGIDITSRNGDYSSGSKEPIDFKNIKDNGFDFAVIRAGWGSEDYPYQNDAQFVHNVTSASENELPFYLSFIAYAQSEEEAYAEADYFLREMNDYFPASSKDKLISVVYNMTYSPYSSNSTELNTSVALAFASKLKENGYNTLIFANKAVYKNLNIEALSENNVGTYYSYYPYVTDFSQEITLPDGTTPDMWQFRSDGYFPYASENGYAKFCIAYMQNEVYNKYDVNHDSEVTVEDVILVLRVIIQLTYADGIEVYSDVDDDSRVTVKDALAIQCYILNYS